MKLIPLFAQTAGSGNLKQGLGIALGIVMAIAFIYGVILIIGGIGKMKDGDATGKMRRYYPELEGQRRSL